MLPFRAKFAVLASLFSALCLFAPVRAQQNPTTTQQKDDEEVIRISTELVQTDVMVFDKSGKFVEGLKPEQFELKVDGQAKPIVFFDRVQAGTVNEDAQLAAARGIKSATGGSVLPLDRGRTVIFFVDDLHLSAGSSMRLRKTLLRFIDEEIGQNDVAAVISASGQVGFLQQFTEDKVVLRAATERINPHPFDVRDTQSPPMTEAHALAIERSDPSVLSYFVDVILRENPGMRPEVAENIVRQRANAILVQSRSIALNTLASLRSAVRGAAPLPGRKILFFISDGFMVEDRGNELRDWMRRVTDAAARSGVVIYSLDAEGLRAGALPDASTAYGFDTSGRLSMTDFSADSLLQSPLYTLAGDTGGRAIVNTNALGHAVSGALKETSLYYLLAWKPDAAPEGGAPKYRRVEVTVRDRPELNVVVRRGFFDTPPPEAAPHEKEKKKKENKPEAAEAPAQKIPASEREIQNALRAPIPVGGLPTALSLGYINGQNGFSLLTASVEVEHTALTYEPGEQPHATFDAVGIVLDDNGKPINGFRQQLDVRPVPGADTTGQHVVFSAQMRIPPGLYQVRVATRDTHSGRVGSAMRWIEVPEFKQGTLTMSSIFLGERQSSVRPEDLKPEDLSHGVLLSVGRRFAHTSWIRLTTFIYNAVPAADSKPDVALQVQLFRDDQPVFTAPLVKVSTDGVPDLTRLPYAAELALASFPAGRYVLQVTAIDRLAKTTATQRTSFVVE